MEAVLRDRHTPIQILSRHHKGSLVLGRASEKKSLLLAGGIIYMVVTKMLIVATMRRILLMYEGEILHWGGYRASNIESVS